MSEHILAQAIISQQHKLQLRELQLIYPARVEIDRVMETVEKHFNVPEQHVYQAIRTLLVDEEQL